MNRSLREEMATLSSAEDFFDYFAVPYDRAVLNVSRLHVLKRFNQYLTQAGGVDELAAAPDGGGAPGGSSPDTAYGRCRALLARAYGDFLESSGLEQKIFRVFQQAQGIGTVRLDSLRAPRLASTA